MLMAMSFQLCLDMDDDMFHLHQWISVIVGKTPWPSSMTLSGHLGVRHQWVGVYELKVLTFTWRSSCVLLTWTAVMLNVLNVSCLSAGIMLVPEGKTVDGFELHFGLNFLGHFLLTNLLLDTLKKSGKHDAYSRIVTMSSATHYGGRLNMEDLQGR